MKSRKCCYSLMAIAACTLGAVPIVAAQPGMASKAPTEPAPVAELRRSRDALIALAELGAALDPAAEVVAVLESRGDADMSDDLLQLAHVQASLEDYDAAEINYRRVIAMRAREQGKFAAALIPVYHALGRTYIDSRRFEDALTVLAHARSISQRNLGLFNLQQVALIDEMTRAHLEAGNTAAAHALQVERLQRAIRHFGADSPKLVPFHRHLGDYYYRHLGDRYANLPSRFHAHDQYSRALEISSAELGDSSPSSLDLLRRLTAVEMHIDDRPRAHERLRAALDAATAIDAKERGMSLAVLGDWAIVNKDQASAERYYSAAYAALRESADIDADDFFATPVLLDFFPPPDGVDGAAPFPRSWGRIELAFDVSAAGRPSDVRTLVAEPRSDALESEYRERIGEAHFRPRLEKGRPVAHSGMSYTHRFRYYVRE